MADGFVLASALAARILRMTAEVWSQPVGDRAEPFDSAWKRLFGAAPGAPLWLCAIEDEGRTVVVRLYARGRVEVFDPRRGSAIRVLSRVDDAAANMTSELASRAPHVARAQRDRSQAIATYSDETHHAKVGGAAESFLLTGT